MTNFFFFSSRRRHTRSLCDWSSDVCSSDLVEVTDGDKWARFEPFEGFKLSFSIEFDHPAFERSAQVAQVDFTDTSYVKQVARAHTFGFIQDVEAMRDSGLALVGSLANSVVVDQDPVLNDAGLRYRYEFL